MSNKTKIPKNPNPVISEDLSKQADEYSESFLYQAEHYKDINSISKYVEVEVYNPGRLPSDQNLIRFLLQNKLFDNGIIKREDNAYDLNKYEYTLRTDIEKSYFRQNNDYYDVYF